MDDLIVTADGPVLRVVFNRPDRHNALTWAMWDGLHDACERADADPAIRLLALSGAGERAFVSGTDISQFTAFTDGADGVAYERRVQRVVDRLESVRVPTLAVVQGYCVGAGLILASACDLRLAVPEARFGAPIARTLGNCLSMNTYSLLVHHLGPARTLDMLLRARLYTGEEAHAAGYVAELCEPGELPVRQAEIEERLLGHSPLSMWAAKEAVRRLRTANLPNGDDLVTEVFGSTDFRTAVAAFLAKQEVTWQGH
ncbi:enoyl-CoA hydratase/isomerase family protein [Nonomuraea maritima]|uniref:enoyl-CoA hydratase/isomerase family protein n=1 Tax=Nonomuraea maritima TaxID=683260 RepID=UPI000B85159D|nr:enoyl-CoA hydratase/isomerase family protein [Nonomuraea maritima]